MSSGAREAQTGAAAIVARIPREHVASTLTAELESHVAALARPSAQTHADILEGFNRSLVRWTRFLATGTMPPERDFDPLREWTRARAAEGVRLEDLLRSFALIHQSGWQMLRSHATKEEAEELLEVAGLLARYVDHVSAVVAETYLAERELLVSEEERRSQTLIERLCGKEPLRAGDRELAARLGVPIQQSYAPFAIVTPGRASYRHAALAARLRREGLGLAVTHSDSVAGLAWGMIAPADLKEGERVLLALGDAVPRSELEAAREEVAVLAEHGRREGLAGVLRVEDHLLEIIIGRSPGLVGRLRTRIVGSMAGGERAELGRTLETLLACEMDRTATSAALGVHRNTLAYRLRRIEELAGLDLNRPRDVAAVYVALSPASCASAQDQRASFG